MKATVYFIYISVTVFRSYFVLANEGHWNVISFCLVQVIIQNHFSLPDEGETYGKKKKKIVFNFKLLSWAYFLMHSNFLTEINKLHHCSLRKENKTKQKPPQTAQKQPNSKRKSMMKVEDSVWKWKTGMFGGKK